MSDYWYSQTTWEDIYQKAKWPSTPRTLPDRIKSFSLGVSQMETFPTALWKKWLLLFSYISPIPPSTTASPGFLTSQYPENLGLALTHTLLISRYLLGTSWLHACGRCWLCPWLLPITLCHTGSKGAEHFLFRKVLSRASLVAQWLRIRLPMQGTQVRALVREDPTCRGATKPVRHNYWACALEPASHNYWAHVPQLQKPTNLAPVLCNKE